MSFEYSTSLNLNDVSESDKHMEIANNDNLNTSKGYRELIFTIADDTSTIESIVVSRKDVQVIIAYLDNYLRMTEGYLNEY